MIDRDRLMGAVRRHDHTIEQAEDRRHGLFQVFDELGLLEKDAAHVSTQRALRLIAEVRQLDIDFTKPVELDEVQLDKSDRLLLALLSTAWVDGLVTGVRAADGEWADGV